MPNKTFDLKRTFMRYIYNTENKVIFKKIICQNKRRLFEIFNGVYSIKQYKKMLVKNLLFSMCLILIC